MEGELLPTINQNPVSYENNESSFYYRPRLQVSAAGFGQSITLHVCIISKSVQGKSAGRVAIRFSVMTGY